MLGSPKSLWTFWTTPEKIKEALNSMEVRELEVEGEKVFLRSKQKSLGGKIFGVLKIKNLKS